MEGGLPLRADDATPLMAKRYPHAVLPEQLASGQADLTAADLYGGPETGANQASYERVADAFAAALAAVERAPVDPQKVAELLGGRG